MFDNDGDHGSSTPSPKSATGTIDINSKELIVNATTELQVELHSSDHLLTNTIESMKKHDSQLFKSKENSAQNDEKSEIRILKTKT